MAQLACASAVPKALGCRGPPPSPHESGIQEELHRKWGQGTAAASGAGQSGDGLLMQTPCLVRWKGQGQWSGDTAGEPCLILGSQQGSVSQLVRAGASDCEEVTGRGSDTSCVPSEIKDAESCPSVGIQGSHWALVVVRLLASLLLCIPPGG